LKKILPAVVAGFAAGVLSIIPFAKTFTCCLIVPGAAVLAVFLQIKVNGEHIPMPLSKGVVLGLGAGFFAAIFGTFFELLITFITHRNDLVDSISQMRETLSNFPLGEELREQIMKMITGMADDIKNTGFSIIYAFSVIFNNVLFDTIFGLIGGLIGAQIFNNRSRELQ